MTLLYTPWHLALRQVAKSDAHGLNTQFLPYCTIRAAFHFLLCTQQRLVAFTVSDESGVLSDNQGCTRILENRMQQQCVPVRVTHRNVSQNGSMEQFVLIGYAVPEEHDISMGIIKEELFPTLLFDKQLNMSQWFDLINRGLI